MKAPEESSRHLLLGAQDQRLGAERYQLLCESTGNFSGNCQETESSMVRACHTPQQLLQNHPSGHLGGWATPWSAEEMLDGQHERVDVSAHAWTAHKGSCKKTGRGSLVKLSSCPPTPPPPPPPPQLVRGLNRTELTMLNYSVKCVKYQASVSVDCSSTISSVTASFGSGVYMYERCLKGTSETCWNQPLGRFRSLFLGGGQETRR